MERIIITIYMRRNSVLFADVSVELIDTFLISEGGKCLSIDRHVRFRSDCIHKI